MGTALATMNKEDKKQLASVLNNSLYVGAKEDSIFMVIEYCEAAGLDVMQKPVHIVPMNTRNPVSGSYEWRDVVMPGIGLYRIQADRSKTMAGITEPEFGPMMTKEFTDKNGNKVSCEFPEWCKISVQKLVGEHIVDFVAKEYWLENYATDSGKSDAPNSMWRKRSRGQIAKCAEAQALRKAFPEIGAQPTAEEMEGKVIDMGNAEVVSQERTRQNPPTPPPYSEAQFSENVNSWKAVIESGKKTPDQLIAMISSKYTLSESQKESIRNLGAIDATQDDDWSAEYDAAMEGAQ